MSVRDIILALALILIVVLGDRIPQAAKKFERSMTKENAASWFSPLRPRAMLVIGVVTSACVFALALVLILPEQRTLRGLLIGLVSGAGAGLLIFGPLALAIALRERLRGWLARRLFAVQWYVSLAMTFSLGYLLACGRNSRFDGYAAVALLVVFIGALTKTAIALVFRSEQEFPPAGGQEPPSAFAPVPKTPDGPVPSLTQRNSVPTRRAV